MQIKVFSVPIVGGEGVTEDLNLFLRGHKILQVDQQLAIGPQGSYWSFCVRYVGDTTNSQGGVLYTCVNVW